MLKVNLIITVSKKTEETVEIPQFFKSKRYGSYDYFRLVPKKDGSFGFIMLGKNSINFNSELRYLNEFDYIKNGVEEITQEEYREAVLNLKQKIDEEYKICLNQ